jgi:phosphonoacetaldehyde hydrolase
LVVFDWTGTLIDHGGVAPVRAMMATFGHNGVALTSGQARSGIGLRKREHIESILRIPDVLRKFRGVHGRAPGRDDIDALLTAYLPEELNAIRRYGQLIDGAAASVDVLRKRGIAIATTTGYCRDAAELVLECARQQGFAPDYAVCADDVLAARPTPFMVHACMQALQVERPREVLVVGDPLLGSVADCHWTRVGVAASGNEVGLANSEWGALSHAERNAWLANAHGTLRDAGADFVIDTLQELPLVVSHIEERRLSSAA